MAGSLDSCCLRNHELRLNKPRIFLGSHAWKQTAGTVAVNAGSPAANLSPCPKSYDWTMPQPVLVPPPPLYGEDHDRGDSTD